MNEITHAIQVLNNGGVICFPTDTVFGIGCRIDNEQAVRRVFAVKQRVETQALPILVSGYDMTCNYVDSIPKDVNEHLIKPYWPGGLTIILPSTKAQVSPLIRAHKNTIGLRTPNHSIPLSLIQAIGVPIVGTSANIHGSPSVITSEALDLRVKSLVDFIVLGTCNGQKESTIIDCSVNPWKIIREGAVKIMI